MASTALDRGPESDNMRRGMHALDAEGWRQRAEEILQEMPPAPIQPLPKEHAFDLSRYKNQLDCTPAEALQNCAEVVEKYDANTCKAHREEIDTLLVFAGLFSAVVTAFTIESYQWLQSDPNDAIIALLTQIARPENQTRSFPRPGGLPDAVSARINAYWFLALTLSLASALIAILCKQWVREFERRGEQSSVQFIGVRQIKLEGFESWGVASIITAIPLLLQSALGLFALGLIELLWKLHPAVAIVVLIPTLAALIFYGVTTFLPGLQHLSRTFGLFITVPQCPFKSPQALLTWRLLFLLWEHVFAYLLGITYWPFIFLFRYCMVSGFRVYAIYRPHVLSDLERDVASAISAEDASHGRVYRSFRLRVLRPWRYSVSTLYDYSRRSHRRAQHRTEGNGFGPHYRVGPVPPTEWKSWVVLDRAFTMQMDEAYDYWQLELDKIDEVPVPPKSGIRGLCWLLKQTNHPGLPQWIWLTMWEILTGVNIAAHPDTVAPSLRYGLLHLHRTMPIQDMTSSQPIALALAFGISYGVKPAVMGELFIHVLPYLDVGVVPIIWYHLSRKLLTHQDIWHSALREILDHLLRTDTGDHGHDPTFLSPGSEMWFYRPVKKTALDLYTPLEFACVITLRFRELCLRSVDGRPHTRFVDAALHCLATNEGVLQCSSVVKSTFFALALDVDHWLEQLDSLAPLSQLPTKLFDSRYRSVYFDLLRPGLDDIGPPSSRIVDAEARLIRQLSRLEEMRKVRDWIPIPGSRWALYDLVMKWPALRDAILGQTDSTLDTHGAASTVVPRANPGAVRTNCLLPPGRTRVA